MFTIAKSIGHAVGVRFAPDNYVTPILRFGRFQRLEGPGFFRITPGVEEDLPHISIGIRTGRFKFAEVMTHDNITFHVHVCIRFIHDPRRAAAAIQSRIVRIPEAGLMAVVQDRTEQILRRRVSAFNADELCGHIAQNRIEQSIHRFLTSELEPLGITVPENGVILGKMKAPALFKQTMLQARRHQQIIEVLAACENADVAEQAIRAEFLNGLESHHGNLTLMSPIQGMMNLAAGALPAANGTSDRHPSPNGAPYKNGRPHKNGGNAAAAAD